MSSSPDSRTRAAVESGIAEVPHMCVSDLFLGVNEENLASNRLVDEGVGDRGAY